MVTRTVYSIFQKTSPANFAEAVLTFKWIKASSACIMPILSLLNIKEGVLRKDRCLPEKDSQNVLSVAHN